MVTLKLLEHYSYRSNGKYLRSECKECSNKRAMDYNCTKKGLITSIYAGQRATSRRRCHRLPNYTKHELEMWLFSQPIFHDLYEVWVASGYKTDLKPSCDRSDDYKPYTLDNIQLMTWAENKAKGYLDMKNGINNKQSRAVVGTSVVGGEEVSFHSMRDAERQNGIGVGDISKCCSGKQKTAGGFKWKIRGITCV